MMIKLNNYVVDAQEIRYFRSGNIREVLIFANFAKRTNSQI